MIVTQQNAQDVADKLLQGKRDELTKLKTQLTSDIIKEYESTLDTKVIEFAKSYGQWIRDWDYVSILNESWGYRSFYLFNNRTTIGHSDVRPAVKLSTKADKKLGEIRDKIEDLETHISDTRRKVISTLTSLRTYSKVKDIFPEAYALLPIKESKALIIDMNKLREQLK